MLENKDELARIITAENVSRAAGPDSAGGAARCGSPPPPPTAGTGPARCWRSALTGTDRRRDKVETKQHPQPAEYPVCDSPVSHHVFGFFYD